MLMGHARRRLIRLRPITARTAEVVVRARGHKLSSSGINGGDVSSALRKPNRTQKREARQRLHRLRNSDEHSALAQAKEEVRNPLVLAWKEVSREQEQERRGNFRTAATLPLEYVVETIYPKESDTDPS